MAEEAVISLLARQEDVGTYLKNQLENHFRLVHVDTIACLYCAASHGRAAIVRVLLAASADAFASTKDDALIRAAVYGRTDTVRVLLAAGADVSASDNQALSHAARYGHADTVRVLLAAGADAAASNSAALRRASSYQDLVE